jgi:hypothetical protein
LPAQLDVVKTSLVRDGELNGGIDTLHDDPDGYVITVHG